MDPEELETNDVLISSLADDPDMAGLVRIYINDLPAKQIELQEALAHRDFAELSRHAHLLRRATFYGFPTITAAAYELESSVLNHTDPSKLERQVEGVVSLCRRARPVVPAEYSIRVECEDR